MNIKVNGEGTSVEAGTLKEFITKHLNGKEPNGIAVAVNDMVVPKSKWDSTIINENDSIEIITAVQGG